jgi:hypothetical protein
MIYVPQFVFDLKEDIHSERKRLKGLGIGSSDGPVSLDDVRRLEKSNAELREQLEEHVVTIETLRTQIKISEAQHEKVYPTSASWCCVSSRIIALLVLRDTVLLPTATSNVSLHSTKLMMIFHILVSRNYW